MSLAGLLTALVGAGAQRPVLKPRDGTPLPVGFEWLPHAGTEERLRRFGHSHRRVLKLKDEASVRALARVRAAVADEPDPEFGELHLVHAAMVMVEETRVTWAFAMDHILDAFSRNAETSAGPDYRGPLGTIGGP